MQMYQGDVAIIKISELPKGAIKQKKPKDRLVLEYGEVTGHAHAIHDIDNCDLYIQDNKRFLEVCYALPLTHEEHDTITLEPGVYEIKRQRQWSVLEQISQRVAD